MTPKDKNLEFNKLIADFDDRLTFERVEWRGNISGEIGNVFDDKYLKYHTSWNWLMPVVEKIKALTEPFIEKDNVVVYFRMGMVISNFCEITYTVRRVSQQESKYHQIPCDTKTIITSGSDLMNAVWLAVAEFLKWYNKEKHVQVSVATM